MDHIECKLTQPKFQKYKKEVIARLKDKVLERRQVGNGYKYRFAGTDDLIDQLVQFIKSKSML